jgi:hypothetical protein
MDCRRDPRAGASDVFSREPHGYYDGGSYHERGNVPGTFELIELGGLPSLHLAHHRIIAKKRRKLDYGYRIINLGTLISIAIGLPCFGLAYDAIPFLAVEQSSNIGFGGHGGCHAALKPSGCREVCFQQISGL